MLNAVYVRGLPSETRVILYDEDAYGISPPDLLLPRNTFNHELHAVESGDPFTRLEVEQRAEDKSE